MQAKKGALCAPHPPPGPAREFKFWLHPTVFCFMTLAVTYPEFFHSKVGVTNDICLIGFIIYSSSVKIK